MLLVDAKKDEKLIITQIVGGKSLNAKLNSMGLISGAECTILKNDPHSPLIVMIKNSRIIVGRGVAEKIEVTIL